MGAHGSHPEAYPIETTKPLFQCISESAFINSPLRFELKSPTNLPLFAELVAKAIRIEKEKQYEALFLQVEYR